MEIIKFIAGIGWFIFYTVMVYAVGWYMGNKDDRGLL